MATSDRSTITLHARHGAPLEDDLIRRTVEATARAIAERHGVRVIRLDAAPDRITATLDVPRLAAIGFAAELRRLSTAWYREHTGIDHLWGDPRPEDNDEHWNPEPLP